MTLNLNRASFIKLSYLALGAYWTELLISAGFQEAGVFSWALIGMISVIAGTVISCLWLLSIYLTKRGWLWVTALFSWFLMGLVNTIGVVWHGLLYSDCPGYLLAIGIACTLYLYLYSFLGLAMPILNHFGLLAPEPPNEQKPPV